MAVQRDLGREGCRIPDPDLLVISPLPGETATFLMPEAWAAIAATAVPSRLSKMRTTPSSQPSTAR